MPLFLLLATGGLIGTSVPLGHVATSAGVPAAVFAFVMCAGGSLLLLVGNGLRGHWPPLSRQYVRYYLITGFISLALPNWLLFTVVPHLGAGPTALMFTLPPLFTMAIAALWGVEPLTRYRTVGILLGLIGAVVLVVGRHGGAVDGGVLWMGLALLIPVALAVGNVYRTIAWPTGANPIALATGMLIAGALWLLPVAAWQATPAHVHWTLPVQAAAAALTYILFFALQRAAGPVYLSQIGYVAAATGVVVGVAVFGERPGVEALAGAACIALGVVIAGRRPVRTA